MFVSIGDGAGSGQNRKGPAAMRGLFFTTLYGEAVASMIIDYANDGSRVGHGWHIGRTFDWLSRDDNGVS